MKTVLIVEDNVEWRELLTIIVTRLGHEAVVARTGKEALEKVSVRQPDLILMDLGLPEVAGDEATVQIKSNPATSHIPIVIQTAFGTSAACKRAREAGAVEMMQKPINLMDVQKLVHEYLSSGDVVEKSNEPARRKMPVPESESF